MSRDVPLDEECVNDIHAAFLHAGTATVAFDFDGEDPEEFELGFTLLEMLKRDMLRGFMYEDYILVSYLTPETN